MYLVVDITALKVTRSPTQQNKTQGGWLTASLFFKEKGLDYDFNLRRMYRGRKILNDSNSWRPITG